jgi:hypothetical protein
MDIRDFGVLYSLHVQQEEEFLGVAGFCIPGKNGYIADYADTPDWLSAGIVTLSNSEKWKTRLKLKLAGCKLSKKGDLPVVNPADRLVVKAEFNPSDTKQARLIITLAILAHYD